MSCGNKFYATGVRQLCSRPKCSELLTPARLSSGSFDSLRTFWSCTVRWFKKQQLEIVCRSNMVNHIGGTYFIGAGLQYFDDVVFLEKPYTEGLFVVAQPAIRLNYLDQAGVREGISTSFVNLCTEQIVHTFDAYAAHLELWLAYLRNVGIEHEELSITPSRSLWTASVFRGWSLDFHYAGVELGDAIYIFDVPQNTRSSLAIVDFSFGLERIFWVATRKKSFFDGIGPPGDAKIVHPVRTDLLRTATLMILSGVTPSSRKCGRLLRNLIRRVVPLLGADDPERDVNHSYGYWQMFLRPQISAGNCLGVVDGEVARARLRASLGKHSVDIRCRSDR
jgi:hypothetical protein